MIIDLNSSHLTVNRERIKSTERNSNSENFNGIDEGIVNTDEKYENQIINQLYSEIEESPDLINYELKDLSQIRNGNPFDYVEKKEIIKRDEKYENHHKNVPFLEIEQSPGISICGLINDSPIQNYNLLTRFSTKIPSISSPLKNEKSSLENENILAFYKFHLKTLFIFFIFNGILKFLKNLIPRYCFVGNVCNCSDNNLFIKIWSIILLQYLLSQFTYGAYRLLPELSKKLKPWLIWQQISCFIILLIFSFVISGQSQIANQLRSFGAGINLIISWIIGMLHMRKLKKSMHFLQTHAI